MLLVQTPSGTVSLPPQGFFQQQPSPFASQLTPTGLPLPRPPVSLVPRIPAPADLNSASLVQPPATIPPSSSPNNTVGTQPGFDGAADDPFGGMPDGNPAAPAFDPADPFGAFDPASALGAIGTLAGPPGAGTLGSAIGNIAAYASQPPAIQQEISLFDAFLDTISPFSLFGQSVENQARDINRDLELNVIESALDIDPGPEPAGPTFGLSEGLPEDFDFDDEGTSTATDPDAADTGFGGGGIGGTPDQDDTSEPEDAPDSPDDPGDPSWICTAAWDTGISAPVTWSKDRRMLAWIVRNDPDAYAGYKKVGPWIAKRVHRGKLLWMARIFPRSWAYEIDQRQGKDTSGYPLSIKIENRLQRAFVRPLFRLWGKA